MKGKNEKTLEKMKIHCKQRMKMMIEKAKKKGNEREKCECTE